MSRTARRRRQRIHRQIARSHPVVPAPVVEPVVEPMPSKRFKDPNLDAQIVELRAYGRPVVTRVELDTEQMTPKKWKSCRAHRHHQPCRRSG
jgi:hypothetical protein